MSHASCSPVYGSCAEFPRLESAPPPLVEFQPFPAGPGAVENLGNATAAQHRQLLGSRGLLAAGPAEDAEARADASIVDDTGNDGLGPGAQASPEFAAPRRRQQFEHERDHDSCPFLAIRKSEWFVRFLDRIPRTSPLSYDNILASFSVKNSFMFYPPPKTYRFVMAATGNVIVDEASGLSNSDDEDEKRQNFLHNPMRRRAEYESRPEADPRKAVGAKHGIGGLGTFTTPGANRSSFETVFIALTGEVQSYRIERDAVILERKVTVGGPLMGCSLGCPIPFSIIRPSRKMSSHIAIFFHCNGEDIGHSSCMRLQTLANALHVTVLVPEYPGYGLLRGSPSEASVKATMERVIQFLLLADGSLTPTRIILIGHSIGTAVAAHIASHIQSIFEQLQGHYQDDVACPGAFRNELAEQGKPSFFEAYDTRRDPPAPTPPSSRPGTTGESFADNDEDDEVGFAWTASRAQRQQRQSVGGEPPVREEPLQWHSPLSADRQGTAAAAAPRHEPFGGRTDGDDHHHRADHPQSRSGSLSTRDSKPLVAGGGGGYDVGGKRRSKTGPRPRSGAGGGCWGSCCDGDCDCESEDDEEHEVAGCCGTLRRRHRARLSTVTHCTHNALGGIILISSFCALRCVEYVPTFKGTYKLHPSQLEVRRRQVPCDCVYPAPLEWCEDASAAARPEDMHFPYQKMTTPLLYRASRFLSFNRFPTVDVLCDLQEKYHYFNHTPLLLVHGVDDELISPIHSVAIASKLRQCRNGGASAGVYLSMLAGGGHNDLPCIREIRRFYKDHILLPHLDRQARFHEQLNELFHSQQGTHPDNAAASPRQTPRRPKEDGGGGGGCRPAPELYFLSREATAVFANEQDTDPLHDTADSAAAAATTSRPESPHRAPTPHLAPTPQPRSRNMSMTRRDLLGPFLHREHSDLSDFTEDGGGGGGVPSAVTNHSLLHTLEQTKGGGGGGPAGETADFAPAATMLHMSMYPRLAHYDVGSVLVASIRANALDRDAARHLYLRHHRSAWIWRSSHASISFVFGLLVLSIGIIHAVLCSHSSLVGRIPAGHATAQYRRSNLVLAWCALEAVIIEIIAVLTLLHSLYGLSSVSRERHRRKPWTFTLYAVLTLCLLLLLIGVGVIMAFVLAFTPGHRGGVDWGRWSALPYSHRVWISYLPRWLMVGMAILHCLTMALHLVKNH